MPQCLCQSNAPFPYVLISTTLRAKGGFLDARPPSALPAGVDAGSGFF
jgi:hypothetical protein